MPYEPNARKRPLQQYIKVVLVEMDAHGQQHQQVASTTSYRSERGACRNLALFKQTTGNLDTGVVVPGTQEGYSVLQHAATQQLLVIVATRGDRQPKPLAMPPHSGVPGSNCLYQPSHDYCQASPMCIDRVAIIIQAAYLLAYVVHFPKAPCTVRWYSAVANA